MKCLAVIVVVFIFLSPCSHSKTILVFNSNENLIVQEVAALVLKKLVAGSEIELEIKPVPPSRATQQNVNLLIDGELARISTYIEKNSSLYRVDPAYYYLTSNVYCSKKLKKKFTKKEELLDYRVAAIRGVVHALEQTEGHKKLLFTSNAEQMFNLLNIGRVDLALDTGINGDKFLRDEKYSKNIEYCGTISRLDLHVYLNSKSKKHLEYFSSKIKAAISSKQLFSIWTEMEQLVLDKHSQHL